MPKFSGRSVWITGGGSGIGRALALEFAREGAAVALSGRRADRLQEVVAAVEAAGGRALAIPCDVTDDAAVAAAVARVREAFGRLDVAVANAGFSVIGRFEELEPGEWRRQFEVNVLGLVSTARRALPALRETRGRLVLIGSVAAYLVPPRHAAYSASKSAVKAIGEALALELRGSGVSCTTVHPGYVETEIVQVDNRGVLDPARRDRRPRWLRWRADEAAREIVAAVVRRRRSVVLSATGKLAAGISRLAPTLVPRLLSGERSSTPRSKVEAPARVLPRTGPPLHLEVTRSPSTAAIYARAAARAPGRPQGVLSAERAARLGSIDVLQRGVRLDPRKLEAYRRVCAVPPNAPPVPLAYPECLFLGLIAEAVLSEAFPFSPFGLIHVRQRVEQLAPIPLDATLELACRLAELRETGRGFEVDFDLEAACAGALAWRGTTTVLSRNAATRAGRERRTREPGAGDEAGFRSQTLEAAADTGRRYAAASDDYSPHHLYAATARLLGYRRAIAHGMWTLGRAVSAIEAERPSGVPVRVEASFKRPLFLPGRAELRLREEDGGRTVRLEVREPESGAPHLVGTLIRGSG